MARRPEGRTVRLGRASRRAAAPLAAALLLGAAVLPAGESFQLFPPSVPPQYYFQPSPPDEFRPLESEQFGSREGEPDALPFDVVTGSPRRPPGSPISLTPSLPKMPRRTMSTLLTVGVLAGSAASSMWAGHAHQSFHFGNEEWFGEGTYAGGADKASHFVFYNGLSRGLGVAYQDLGYERDRAVMMAFATSVAAGLIVEIGDGLTVYGFGWEDLAMDTLGAGTAALITHYGLDDTVGFRFGKVSADQPPACCRTPGVGKDYSEEIYTADVKLAGLAPRVHVRPGPARFLLFSVSYGSKGYRYSEPDFRQRNIGLELGLNIPEILSVAGVPETKWWGQLIYGFFNFFRIPFTSIGVYFDLNHNKWHGPNAGNVYNPGP
jgi:Predicted periplasmic lipoprotein (DUF2279)